jgi:trans-2,3-dihydro-3-hydroxyanthranilate isomerase
MTQVDPKFGLTHDRETVVRASGLRDGDIDPSLPIQTVSTGLVFTVVPLRGLDVIRRLQLDLKSASEYLERSQGGKFFYFVTRETVDPTARLHARMLFYNGEDPATGSAAGCTISYLVRNGFAASDEQVHIRQGIEMKRPSAIDVRAKLDGDLIREVRVAGSTVFVANGRFFLE